MNAEEYRDVLSRCGGVQEEIPLKERWRLVQSWREIYAAPHHARTGKWKDGQFEWHVFSARSYRVLNGARAMDAYEAERPKVLLVFPEEEEYPAVRVQPPHGKDRRPDFAAVYGDVHVCPSDFAWTMAFTHEHEMGLGPYFCRREWVG